MKVSKPNMDAYRGDQSQDFRRKVSENNTAGSKSVVVKQGIKDVNVAQGPRTGVAGRAGKRADFMARKDEALSLSETIQNAYAQRQQRDYAEKNWPGEGAIEQNVPPRRFKR
jgi:hypothetical protein